MIKIKFLTIMIEIEFGPFTDTLTFTDGTTQLEQCIDVTLAAVDNTFRQQNVVNVFMATTTFQGATSMLILGQLFLTDLTGKLKERVGPGGGGLEEREREKNQGHFQQGELDRRKMGW